MNPNTGLHLDLERWNNKYRHSSTSEDPGEPETELVRAVTELETKGLALDLACGRGKDSVFLAQQGFEVISVDGAIEAMRNVSILKQKHSLMIHPIVADLRSFAILPDTFDLIVMIRYLQRDLFQPIQAGLKSGGHIFIKTFNSNYLKYNPSFKPEYLLSPLELQTTFSSLETIDHNQGELETYSYLFARKH